MPGKKKIGSRRSEQEIDQLYLDSFDALKNALKAINDQLKSGRGLSDEQIRLLKRSPALIAVFKARETEQTEEKGLPEGKLKEFVERAWSLEKLLKPHNLTHEDLMSREYYRCPTCGELHFKGRSCPYEALKRGDVFAGTDET
jgi:ribosomal protein L32